MPPEAGAGRKRRIPTKTEKGHNRGGETSRTGPSKCRSNKRTPIPRKSLKQHDRNRNGQGDTHTHKQQIDKRGAKKEKNRRVKDKWPEECESHAQRGTSLKEEAAEEQ